MEIYSIHNKGQSAVAEKIMRTLKNKTYKYKEYQNMCILINSMTQWLNTTYYRTIKMKPVNVKPSIYCDLSR